MAVPADPFGTAGLRAAVLAGWAASPARFREDANAEEDLALGGYRDRALVELAQNANDAAARDGQAGRLLLRLREGELAASNTGAVLSAEGVEALCTLRASAKRDASSVGRFGVGFAAVLGLSDAPRVCSTTGAVGFDRARSRAEVERIASLADELVRRGGAVPALRLPWPLDEAAEPGWATTVRLPLRDGAAEGLARRLLEEVGPGLLLGLSHLDEVVIELDGRRRLLAAARDGDEVVVLDDGMPSRWRSTHRTELLPAALLSERPTEERDRRRVTLRWAVPVDAQGRPAPWPDRVPRVVHAPTPTALPCSLPALLLADLPLDPTRRQVAEGALTEHLVGLAAAAYVDLVAALGHPALVPRGMPLGPFDASLTEAVLDRLPHSAVLPGGLSPADVVAVPQAPPGLIDALGAAAPATLPELWVRDGAATTALRVRRVGLGELLESLDGPELSPARWREVYATLVEVPAEDLAGLPVPLADGRTARGPRGLLLPEGPVPAGLAELGLRLVHPQAAHPVLRRAGAIPAGPAQLLADPAVRAAVLDGPEAAGLGLRAGVLDGPEAAGLDPARLATLVLGLVAAADVGVAEHPWLAELELPDDAGELSLPEEMALPGAPVLDLVEPGSYRLPDPAVLEAVGPTPLRAVGVRWSIPLLAARDWLPGAGPDEGPAPLASLDGVPDWVAEVLEPLAPGHPDAVLVPEAVVLGDLDLVHPDAWPAALAVLAADRELRAAVCQPFTVLAETTSARVTGYSAWWLRRNVRLAGASPTGFRLPGTDGLLAALFDPLPDEVGLDPELAAALGVVTDMRTLLAQPGGPDRLLDRLTEPGLALDPATLSRCYAELVAAAAQVEPPERVRAVLGEDTVVRPAAQVLVADRPDLLPLLASRPHLRVSAGLAGDLAALLAVEPATRALARQLRSAELGRGQARAVPEPAHRLRPSLPSQWVEHDEIRVDGVDLPWLLVEGVVHAATMAGLARGLAWVAGDWPGRHQLEAALLDPVALPELLAEADLDP